MQGIVDLFFPKRCVNCHRIMGRNKKFLLCVNCFSNLTFTHWQMNTDNATYNNIAQNANVAAASSLLFYSGNNAAKRLVMSNKYYNMPQIGEMLASIAAKDLKSFTFDVITCIPSHHTTVKKRGYNQVEKFAESLAVLLNTQFNSELIKRVERHDSQTHRNRKERLHALKNAFEVTDEINDFQKILLVDDVITTGATMSNCCQTILNKKFVELYVYTMAKVI